MEFDFEKGILASIILEPIISIEKCSQVKATNFINPIHAYLFGLMLSLYESSKPIDLTSIMYEIKKSDKDITSDYIMSLNEFVPSSSNIDLYIEHLLEQSRLSEIRKLQAESFDGYTSKEIATKISEKIDGLFLEEQRKGTTVNELAFSVGKNLDVQVFAPKTHLIDLNHKIGGFCSPDLIYIAGRPGMGKTSIMVDMFKNLMTNHVAVLFVSLEMSREQIMWKLWSNACLIPTNKFREERFRKGSLTQDDWSKIQDWNAKNYAALSCGIIEDDSCDMMRLKSKIRRAKIQKEIKVCFVDYLQFIVPSERNATRNDEVSEISRGLKAIAKEFDLCMVVASQLSRAVENRADKIPNLSDLRDSGSLEQDADIVLFPFNPAYYEKTSKPAEIHVRKNRLGDVSDFKVNFRPQFGRFENYSNADEAKTF